MIDVMLGRDRDTPLVVYCQAGVRSIVAASVLRRIGFTRVFSLAGGLDACNQLEPPRATPHHTEVEGV